MAGKVVDSSFVLLSKFGASRQESASKTATSHIRETLCYTLEKPLFHFFGSKITLLFHYSLTLKHGEKKNTDFLQGLFQ